MICARDGLRTSSNIEHYSKEISFWEIGVPHTFSKSQNCKKKRCDFTVQWLRVKKFLNAPYHISINRSRLTTSMQSETDPSESTSLNSFVFFGKRYFQEVRYSEKPVWFQWIEFVDQLFPQKWEFRSQMAFGHVIISCYPHERFCWTFNFGTEFGKWFWNQNQL